MKRRQILNRLLQAGAVAGLGAIGIKVLPGLMSKPVKAIFALDLRESSTPLPEHLLTPLSEFYVQSYAVAPTVDVAAWNLKVTGAVATPLTLTLADVMSAPQETFYLTMECIGNPAGGNLIGNAEWTGTPLLPFLQRAGVQPEAVEFVLHGADGYRTTLPVADVMRPDVRLVHLMNGQPLSKEHGYPLRILVPGHFGQKQPKWLTGIEAIVSSQKGYWERWGWSNTALIPTHALSRQLQQTRVWNGRYQVSFPKTGEAGWGNGVLIAGVALDGSAPIQRISVSLDGGNTWNLAEQSHPTSPHEWTIWRLAWRPEQPGRYILLARAESNRSPHPLFGDSIQPLDDPISRDGSSGILKIQVDLEA